MVVPIQQTVNPCDELPQAVHGSETLARTAGGKGRRAALTVNAGS
jgi:hypothetical protein